MAPTPGRTISARNSCSTVHNPLPRDRSRTRATYWVRLIKPWLSALVAPDGYSITMTKHFERAGTHYWGAVAER